MYIVNVVCVSPETAACFFFFFTLILNAAFVPLLDLIKGFYCHELSSHYLFRPVAFVCWDQAFSDKEDRNMKNCSRIITSSWNQQWLLM